jgi:hypothetical protein
VVHRRASGRLTRSASRYACGCCEALLDVEAFNAAQQLNVFETRPAAREAGFRVSVIVAFRVSGWKAAERPMIFFSITSDDAPSPWRKMDDRRSKSESDFPLEVAEALIPRIDDLLERLDYVVIVVRIAFAHV